MHQECNRCENGLAFFQSYGLRRWIFSRTASGWNLHLPRTSRFRHTTLEKTAIAIRAFASSAHRLLQPRAITNRLLRDVSPKIVRREKFANRGECPRPPLWREAAVFSAGNREQAVSRPGFVER